MKLNNFKKLITDNATDTRDLRDRMRKAKQQSRTARRRGDINEADLLMRDGVDLWDQANDGRDLRRHRHLAYAYLKGRSYLECENSCRRGNEPNAHEIRMHAYPYLLERADEMAGIEQHLATWLKDGTTRRVRPVEAVEAVEAVCAPKPNLARRVLDIMAGA
jgi:hypothetical protein